MHMDNNKNSNNDSIRKSAMQFAEANIYRMDNPYLNQFQKLEVELWFQFPSIVAFTTLCGLLIINSFHLMEIYKIIGIPVAVEIFLSIVNWYFYEYFDRINRVFFITIGHNIIQWIISLITISILCYNGYYFWATFIFLGKLGLIGILSPSTLIFIILSKKYKMHPKYAFFKMYYGDVFPFEENN